jgi:preprotein translocase subunit SecE
MATKEKSKKASQQKAGNEPQAKQEREGLVSYLVGVRQEFKKVVWPTRQELTSSTIVVFAVCAFFAIGFWLVDTGFLAALRGILGISLT